MQIPLESFSSFSYKTHCLVKLNTLVAFEKYAMHSQALLMSHASCLMHTNFTQQYMVLVISKPVSMQNRKTRNCFEKLYLNCSFLKFLDEGSSRTSCLPSTSDCTLRTHPLQM